MLGQTNGPIPRACRQTDLAKINECNRENTKWFEPCTAAARISSKAPPIIPAQKNAYGAIKMDGPVMELTKLRITPTDSKLSFFSHSFFCDVSQGSGYSSPAASQKMRFQDFFLCSFSPPCWHRGRLCLRVIASALAGACRGHFVL